MNVLCKSTLQLLHKVLDEVVVTSIFQKNNTKKDDRVINIGGLYWVALTSQLYYDHTNCYQVCDHSTCLKTLNQMSTYEVLASIHEKPYVQTKEEHHMDKVKQASKSARSYLRHCITMFATPREDLAYPTTISDVGHGHL